MVFAPTWWAALRADHMTSVGETRSVALDDGSRLVLDSDSAVAVDFDAGARQLRVLRGAAWFDVQPDPARPFRVEADGVTATALGTAYAVDIRSGVTDVAVNHGVVEVARAGSVVAKLLAGQRIRMEGPAPAVESSDAQTEARYAFRDGLLAFDGERLDAALSRIDRYLDQRVILLNGTDAGAPVTAVFPIGDAELALEALARSHHLRVRRWPGLILIDRAPAGA
jgi:transmembrane sensor